jgi:hypothetical protein
MSLMMVQAEDALDRLTGNESDCEIASRIADYYLAFYEGRRRFKFLIFHDTRKCGPKQAHNADELFRTGPCLVELQWHRKNVAGISTTDIDFARQWIIDAMVFGYAVYMEPSGTSKGRIASIRERIRRDGFLCFRRERENA